MKKRYEAPELELLRFTTENIALTSISADTGGGTDWGDLIGGE